MGIASSLGTATGGFGHIVAAALGLSAILATSAELYSVVRYAGAAYLVLLGIRALFGRESLPVGASNPRTYARRAFRQGVVTELLNPKTALFFLAFLPQFINRSAPAVPQAILLGSISVLINASADVVVALVAGPFGERLRTTRWQRRQRLTSSGMLIGLGAYVAVSGNRK